MLSLASLWLLVLASQTLAYDVSARDTAAADSYASGAVMQEIMSIKETTWAKQEAAGAYKSEQYPKISHFVPCINGKATAIPGNANYTFRCDNIDLFSFKSHSDLGSIRGQGSSSWGWTSPLGREFVAIGQYDGAAFVEITKTGQIVYLGRLPPYSTGSIWREIRGFKHYMIIGSDSAPGHGVQIFDMRKLLTVNPFRPVTFSNDKDLTGHFDGLPSGSTHNVVVNEATNFVYAVGAQPRNDKCRAGLIFINMTDASNPTSPGCAAQEGYVHDAQCLIYKGPHKENVGKEICYGYNEKNLVIYDVSDKSAPLVLSKTTYNGASYVHQGWVLDPENQEYLISDDELDEERKAGLAADGKPVTYIWDIKNLTAPKVTGHYKSNVLSIDHNQYVHDGKAFQSNYGSGFRVLDISSIPDDPTGAGVEEIGFFDVYPEDDALPGGGEVDFVGTWSSYAYFKSGFIFVNTIERGAFVLRLRD